MSKVLNERYPQIEFLTQLSPSPSYRLEHHSEAGTNLVLDGLSLHSADHKIEFQSLMEKSLEGIETVLVYGIGYGHHFDFLKSWLEGDERREITFMEDDIRVVSALAGCGRFDAIFNHPRVHLALKLKEATLEEYSYEVMAMSPTDKIAIFALRAYEETKKESYEALREYLFRASLLVDSVRKETLYYHQLMANLIPNFRRIPGSFYVNRLLGKFKGVPAIICGAGPSLEKALPVLRRLENQALIFGGGSTVSALSNGGVRPHFAAAIDPNPQEWNCLKMNSAFEVPFVFGSRVLPKVFDAVQGDLGYMQTFSGGAVESMIEEALGLDEPPVDGEVDLNGLSVTTLCINMAVAMGCNPICLVGLDLAYTDSKRYAGGVVDEEESKAMAREVCNKSGEQPVERTGRNGESVHSLIKWVMESAWVSEKAKRSKARFINSTPAGLGFEGIEYRSLDDVVSNFSEGWDLRGWLRTEIENARIEGSTEQIDEVLSGLFDSLKRVERSLEELIAVLEEHRRLDYPMAILHMSDMRDEEGYKKLLGNIEHEILLDVKRSMPRKELFSGEEMEEKYELECEVRKFKWMLCIVKEYGRWTFSPSSRYKEGQTTRSSE